MKRLRLLLADDHAVLRAGLRLLLDAQPDFEVVAEAGDGAGAVEQTRTTAPDIALLDISMPGLGSAETVKQLLRVKPDMRVIMLTMHDDPAYVRAAILAGAVGYVLKKVVDLELLLAIRAVAQGRMFIDSGGVRDRGESSKNGNTEGPRRRVRVTAREAQVLRLLAQGYTNREAAKELRVSVKTVETHRARLAAKLKLRGRAELYRFAVESGLLAPDPA
jgi:two-component system response regulator NreC